MFKSENKEPLRACYECILYDPENRTCGKDNSKMTTADLPIKCLMQVKKTNK